MNLDEMELYLDTPIRNLVLAGAIDRTVERSCQSAVPPLTTAGQVRDYLVAHGTFAAIPGCRRHGRIAQTLHAISAGVNNMPTPAAAAATDDSGDVLAFMDAATREQVETFEQANGYKPMFVIVGAYLGRRDATRNDRIFGHFAGLLKSPEGMRYTAAQLAEMYGLTRERVRQVAQTYQLPDALNDRRLWASYANHSTFFINENSACFRDVVQREVPDIEFDGYAAILKRTAMLDLVDGRFLARVGWEPEIKAWVDRLERLSAMPRSIDSQLSLQGLSMGGKLDARLKLVVLNQIAPSFGIRPLPPDGIVLSRNL